MESSERVIVTRCRWSKVLSSPFFMTDAELLDKFERIIFDGKERFVLRCCRERYGNLREAIENVIC